MVSSLSDQPIGRHRRSAEGRIHAIENRWRGAGRGHASDPGYARCVGRVGALAVVLGVGATAVGLPMAFADTTDSAGSRSGATSDASSTAGATTRSRVGARADRDAAARMTGSGEGGVAESAPAVDAADPAPGLSLIHI